MFHSIILQNNAVSNSSLHFSPNLGGGIRLENGSKQFPFDAGGRKRSVPRSVEKENNSSWNVLPDQLHHSVIPIRSSGQLPKLWNVIKIRMLD